MQYDEAINQHDVALLSLNIDSKLFCEPRYCPRSQLVE
jgi:hypothetical protein